MLVWWWLERVVAQRGFVRVDCFEFDGAMAGLEFARGLGEPDSHAETLVDDVVDKVEELSHVSKLDKCLKLSFVGVEQVPLMLLEGGQKNLSIVVMDVGWFTDALGWWFILGVVR